MKIWELTKRIKNEGGTRELQILAGADGKKFRDYVCIWCAEGEEYEGARGEGFWVLFARSGHFGSTEECESAARANPVWLQGNQ